VKRQIGFWLLPDFEFEQISILNRFLNLNKIQIWTVLDLNFFRILFRFEKN
jgi:hypothetical protein